MPHEFNGPDEEHDLSHGAAAHHRRAELAEHNFGKSGERGAGSGERGIAFSEVVGLMACEFRGAVINLPVAEEVLDFLADQGVLSFRTKVVDYTEAQRMAVFSAILTYTYEHPSLPDQFAARYVFNQPWLDDMLGHLTQTTFAESIGVAKQRVNQAVDQAREHFTAKGFDLPFRPGEERNKKARGKMHTAYHDRTGKKKMNVEASNVPR